ncbi:uncharacterized protein LOC133176210 [Saccostrea echinata]|uniref:uncharacterized protein LOC133176210 n=1 Tax=Saccostrea echinata TaxID=191078 RepID=UPI002A7F1587|nr:uncharacterized protein LOC133176210 [Saccostrea echinata]
MALQVDPEEMDTHDEEFLGLQAEPMDCHGQEICISEHQHMNPAGGFVFTTTQEAQLQRFLCLGASCNGYQTGRRRELKLDDAGFILQLVGDGYGKKVVDFLTDFSTNCRSFKQDPTLLLWRSAVGPLMKLQSTQPLQLYRKFAEHQPIFSDTLTTAKNKP